MVKSGIYYYCKSEDDIDKVTEQFAVINNSLRKFEQYKMNDIAHYFIKFCDRDKSRYIRDPKEMQTPRRCTW